MTADRTRGAHRTAPCFQCPLRTGTPNCHATCERYKVYAAWRELLRRHKELQRQGRDASIRAVEKKWMNKVRKNR